MTRLSTLSRSIAGRTVIITGAASGMGRATARLFADEGANVAALDVSEDALEAVVSDITTVGLIAKGWAFDITDKSVMATAVAEIVTAFGGIDIVVNNAGGVFVTTIDDDNYAAAWDKSMAVMLEAQASLTRACLPQLRQSSSPRVINIASTEGLGATAYNSPYVVAKHGVVGLTRALAVELGKEGITVNCVCPGPIHTGITEAIPDEQKQLFAKRRTALRRYGEPEEVAHATLNFALPSASFMTGAVLPVDGGVLARNA